jgi:hypothetical protein
MIRHRSRSHRLLRYCLFALLMPALCAAARAASDCPSPEACLARALQRQWQAYYGYIDGAWSAYREDRAMYEQARKLNDAALIAETQERLAASERVFRHARAMAEAVANPGFGAYLEGNLQRRQSRLDGARARAEREKRLLDGYLRQSGPARQAALKDMVGYAEEADRLEGVLVKDSVRTAAGGLLEYAMTLKLGAYGETGRQLAEQVVLAANSAVSGLDVQHEAGHGQTMKASLEATAAVGTVVTAFSRMAKAPALEVVGGAEIYAGLLGMTLDSVLMLQNAVHIEEARGRYQEAGLHEQRFGERVHKAEVEIRRLTRMRDQAQNQIDQRGRIAALLERMKEEQ